MKYSPHFLTLLAIGACGDDPIDAATAAVVDAPPPKNPSILWLNDQNGNEGSLRLVGVGPPGNF